MNRAEFLSSLQAELWSLPLEERVAAMKYYEEYFEEAGPDREQEILAELGDPPAVAATILRDYSSVPVVTDRPAYNRQFAGDPPPSAPDAQSAPGAHSAQGAQSAPGAQPEQGAPREEQFWEKWRLPVWVWIIIIIFVLPVLSGGAAMLIGLLGGIMSVLFSVAAVLFTLLFAGFLLFFAVALAGIAMLVGGLAGVVAGIMAFMTNPGAGILGIGVGSLLASLGLLVTALGLWLVSKALPKAIRAFTELVNRLIASITEFYRKKVKRA